MARPATVTSTMIVAMAMAMIEEEGLPAFSVEKLARNLGVTGPALYNHFRRRDDILSAVAQLVIGEVPPVQADPPDDSGWQDQLLTYALNFRRVVQRYPSCAPLVVTHLPRRTLLHSYERLLRLLERAGIPPAYHLVIIDGLEKLTLGSSMWLAHALEAGDGSSDELPSLHRAVEANQLDAEALFVTAARSFLAGMGAAVAAGSG